MIVHPTQTSFATGDDALAFTLGANSAFTAGAIDGAAIAGAETNPLASAPVESTDLPLPGGDPVATAATTTAQAASGSAQLGTSVAGLAVTAAVAVGTGASPFVINVTYDSSVASAPAGFTAVINSVVQYLESLFNDPVTININIGYGEVNGNPLNAGALGQSLTFLNSYSYTQVRTALTTDAKSTDDLTAVATLPATSPVNGTFWMT
jgi:hypothetical protein